MQSLSQRIYKAWLRLRYLYRGIGAKDTLLRIFRKIISPIYCHEIGYITFTRVEPRSRTGASSGPDSMGTEAVVLELPDALRALKEQMPSSIPQKWLEKHLSHGEGCIVILARRMVGSDQEHQVVGYRLCQRGYFSALGINRTISPEFIWTIHHEVLPEYRGQRVGLQMRLSMHDYCARHGISKALGFMLSHNKPSLRHHTRGRESSSGLFLGTVESVSILGGLFWRTTPWEEIQQWLDSTQSR